MTQQSTLAERRPFLSAPNPNRYFPATAIEEARQRLLRAVVRNEGPALLIGGAGIGKSLLLAVLAEQLTPRMTVVALAGAQLCTRRALLQVILCELGLPYRGMDEGELRLSIQQHLRGKEGPRRLVLLVDEADSLPVRLLEELRVLTNLAVEGFPLVSLVLAGGPILEERFADPQLDMFSQRIAARCYLAPLGREETRQYVRSQAAAVGLKPEKLFADDALEAIYAATGGMPRLINQLGDQLVWMAEEAGCVPLDASLVQQAWSDLQQLPAPWNGDAAPATPMPGSSVIEFGELDGGEPLIEDEVLEDDDDDELPASIPIAAGRSVRRLAPDQHGELLEATLDEADELLEGFDRFDRFDRFDQFVSMELRTAEPAPAPHKPATPLAADPFAESFAEEEVVLDPYALFESELLRSAPQVVNRLDRSFAGELDRCVQRSVASDRERRDSAAKPHDSSSSAGAAKIAAGSKTDSPNDNLETVHVDSPIRLHDLAPSTPAMPVNSSGDWLIVEDDDPPAAAVVQGRQFRRLFSNLAASAVQSQFA